MDWWACNGPVKIALPLILNAAVGIIVGSMLYALWNPFGLDGIIGMVAQRGFFILGGVLLGVAIGRLSKD